MYVGSGGIMLTLIVNTMTLLQHATIEAFDGLNHVLRLFNFHLLSIFVVIRALDSLNIVLILFVCALRVLC